MAEEQRLSAAEFLQYFLSRYKVNDGNVEPGSESSDAPLIATPLAVAGTQDDDETDGD